MMQRPIFILTVLAVFVLALGLPHGSYAGCGDGRCKGNESVSSCPEDCVGAPPRYDVNVGWVGNYCDGYPEGLVQDAGAIDIEGNPECQPIGAGGQTGRGPHTIVVNFAAGPDVNQILIDLSNVINVFGGRENNCFRGYGAGAFVISVYEDGRSDSVYWIGGYDDSASKTVKYNLLLHGEAYHDGTLCTLSSNCFDGPGDLSGTLRIVNISYEITAPEGPGKKHACVTNGPVDISSTPVVVYARRQE